MQSNVPSITLPIGDFDTVVNMSDLSVIGVFRLHVFARRRSHRVMATIPEHHTSYYISRTHTRVVVSLCLEEDEIFRCIFVPSKE